MRNCTAGFLKNQGIGPQYTEEVTTMAKAGTVTVGGVEGEVDDLFKQAVQVVCQYDRASASLAQPEASLYRGLTVRFRS